MRQSLYVVLIVVSVVALTGCGSTRFTMQEPSAKDMSITGIGKETKIVEMTDSYDGQLSSSNSLWVVVKEEDDKYRVGSLDLTSASVTNFKEVQDFNSDSSSYWTKLKLSTMGGGAKIVGALFSGTIFGGKTEDYSFEVQKVFGGDENHRVHVSYGYTESGSSVFGTQKTETHTGSKLKFVIGDNVAEPVEAYGYTDRFGLLNENIKKTRFYPIGDRRYVSIQPEKPEGGRTISFLFYDLGTAKTSWGAEFELNKEYVDGGVSKDGSTISIVLGEPGEYTLRRYTPQTLIDSVKQLQK
jgi:hypothetical protein